MPYRCSRQTLPVESLIQWWPNRRLTHALLLSRLGRGTGWYRPCTPRGVPKIARAGQWDPSCWVRKSGTTRVVVILTANLRAHLRILLLALQSLSRACSNRTALPLSSHPPRKWRSRRLQPSKKSSLLNGPAQKTARFHLFLIENEYIFNV